MKLVIMSMLLMITISAEAAQWKDILPILIGGGNAPSGPMPFPGGPGYPQPGYGVTCRAEDRGHEEHWGGHYSCGECLQRHGECIETCSSSMVECRVEGRDRYGYVVSFVGRGRDRWAAESEGIRACQYNYATNCYAVSCSQQNQIISRRSCR